MGIDPGNKETAFCILRGDKKIIAFAKLENEYFASRIPIFFNLSGAPVRVACEAVACYGMVAGASLFETCFFTGRLQELVGVDKLTLITRTEIKKQIGGRNDSQIRTKLIELFGAPGTKKTPGNTYGITADCWAALAVAETLRRGDFKPYIYSYNRK